MPFEGAAPSEVNTSCTSKALAYEERGRIREGELSAIEKTIDLLSTEDIQRTQGAVGVERWTRELDRLRVQIWGGFLVLLVKVRMGFVEGGILMREQSGAFQWT